MRGLGRFQRIRTVLSVVGVGFYRGARCRGPVTRCLLLFLVDAQPRKSLLKGLKDRDANVIDFISQ